MSHHIYCHGMQNISAGGTVGYLTRLFQAFTEFRPSMKTDDNTNIVFHFPKTKCRPSYVDDISPEQFLGEKKCYTEIQTTLKDNETFNRKTWRVQKYSRIYRELPVVNIFNTNDNACSIHINGSNNFFPIWNQLRLLGKSSSTLKILTTHNPIAPHLEEIEILKSKKKWTPSELNHICTYLELRDKIAFLLSDAIFCPYEHSLDSYHNWSAWDDIIKHKPIYYCLTGAPKRKQTKTKIETRQQLKIPVTDTVIIYIGRKEKVKGFHIFAEAAKHILSENRHIWFVAIGNGSIPSGISDEHFLEIGFTNEIGNFIATADACVIANRDSYFDLGMIEVLSLGCLLIASDVGGNKWLKGKSMGTTQFPPENSDSLVQKIYQVSRLSESKKSELSQDNIRLYNEYLTPFHFQQNYQLTIDKIRKDLGKDLFIKKINEPPLTSSIISKNHETINNFIRIAKSIPLSFFHKNT